jgi:hypothetical protein
MDALSRERNIADDRIGEIVTGARTTREHLKQHAAAILPAGVAVAVAAAVRPLFQGRVPQAIFGLAVVGAAAYGGLGPGLPATALSTAAIGWLFPSVLVGLLQIRPGPFLHAAGRPSGRSVTPAVMIFARGTRGGITPLARAFEASLETF